MATRIVPGRIPLQTLQRYHHSVVNTFGEHETLVDAVANRPGFFGASPVAFLSLVARRPTIRTNDLDEAVLNDRTLIRANCFRGSLFLLSAVDYPVYYRALIPILRTASLQTLLNNGISERMMEVYAERIQNHDSAIPLSHLETLDVLFRGSQKRPNPIVERLLIRKLCDLGILVRAASKGWKGNQFNYASFNKWLPDTILRLDSPESARMEMVRKYLRCYGPVSMEDISWWTGLPIIQISRTIINLRREVIRILVEGYREELLCLRESYEAMSNNIIENLNIQLLPPWDPFMLGWSNRHRVVKRNLEPYVFDSGGNATSVMVHRGRVIGVWQFRDSQNNMLEFHIFEPYKLLKKEALRACEQHSRILAELCGANTVDIIEKGLPMPLDKCPKGSFLWPLGKDLPILPTATHTQQKKVVTSNSNTFKGPYLDHEFVVGPSR